MNPSLGWHPHWRGPNSPIPDCCSFLGAWKAARSRHPGGVNALRRDGAVTFISDTISLETWRNLATRKGGEVIGEF